MLVEWTHLSDRSVLRVWVQSVAVFTPLIVILVFTFLKTAERGDVKEASLGETAARQRHQKQKCCFFIFYFLFTHCP